MSEVVVQVNEAAGDGRQPESSKCASSALSLLCRNQIRKPSETEKLGKAHSISLLAKSEEEPLEDHPVQCTVCAVLSQVSGKEAESVEGS